MAKTLSLQQVALLCRVFLFLASLLLVSPVVFSQQVVKCCYCNNTLKTYPTGFGEDRSKLRICDDCKGKRCKKIAEIEGLIEQVIGLDQNTTVDRQWNSLVYQHKNSIDIALSQLWRYYCEDTASQSQVNEIRATLGSLRTKLPYEPGELLQERRKMARVDLGVKELDTLSCVKKKPATKDTTDPLNKITCPPETNEKTESDNKVLEEFVKEKLREAGETVAEGSEELMEKLEKLKTAEKYWGYYQQILQAKCVPFKLMQATQDYMRAKKIPGEDLGDECTILCNELSAWYANLTGNSQLQKPFFEYCFNECR